MKKCQTTKKEGMENTKNEILVWIIDIIKLLPNSSVSKKSTEKLMRVDDNHGN